jgi:ecotin
VIATLNVFIIIVAVSYAESETMKPYPQPEEGYDRMVIHLESLTDENLHKAELLLGKTMELDCNLHFLPGTLARETVKGWGYSTIFCVMQSGRPPQP